MAHVRRYDRAVNRLDGLTPPRSMIISGLSCRSASRPHADSQAERFIQTALREWAYAQAYQNSDQRTAELPNWLHRYNWHRPHGSLKANTPISRLGLAGNNLLRLHSGWSARRFLGPPALASVFSGNGLVSL